MEFVSVLVLSLLLGIKHSLEPDHVIAVSTLAGENKGLRKASKAGVLWGVGHTLTIALVALIVFAFKFTISETLEGYLESLVGIMIIYLGVRAFVALKKPELNKFSPLRPVAVGFVHGLAGSAAMIVVIAATVDTLFQAILYLVLFGVGTVIGMMLFTLVIASPFVFFNRKETFTQGITIAISIFSIAFGINYIL